MRVGIVQKGSPCLKHFDHLDQMAALEFEARDDGEWRGGRRFDVVEILLQRLCERDRVAQKHRHNILGQFVGADDERSVHLRGDCRDAEMLLWQRKTLCQDHFQV